MVAVTLLLLLARARGEEVTGKVVGIHDGDTLTLLTAEKNQVKVRLDGIDAPELDQPFGNASKQALSKLAFGKAAVVQVSRVDRYKRTLGNIFVGDVWVNLVLVQNGFAWQFLKYNKDPRLKEAENKARGAHLGVWQDANPIPPWAWRDEKTKG